MFEGFSESYLLDMALAWGTLAALMTIVVGLRLWRLPQPAVRRFLQVYLAVWMTALCLLAAETAFALFYDTTDSFGLTKTTKRWYVRHVQRNNWGARDSRPYSVRPADGKRRLTIVGDSFTFGHGVANPADRFADRLARRLERHQPGLWEVCTLAVEGADTKFQLRMLNSPTHEGYHTDLFLLVYCLNDIETLLPDNEIVMGTIIHSQPSRWLMREFYLPNFLYYRFKHFSRPELVDYFGWLRGAYTGPIWETQCQRLDGIRRWCQNQNVEMLMVVFPFLHRLGADYPFAEAHERLEEYCTSRQIACLDLLPIMRQHQREGLVVNRFDAHPNERAHALAAQAIWEDLVAPRVP